MSAIVLPAPPPDASATIRGLVNTSAQTFAGTKTFSAIVSPTIGPASGQQHTLPAVAADTIALLAASQTLTNKTISGASNTFSNIPESAITNLVSDLASKANDSLVVHLAGAENITGAKTFANGTLLQANSAGTFTHTFASAATANRIWTIPDVTDTAVGLAATQTLTNKTISGSSNTLSNIPESAITNLVSDLAAKATDSLVVHLAGTETVTGAKTFNSDITAATSTAATSGAQLVNSPKMVLAGAYWNGTASTTDSAAIVHDVDSTSPTSHLSFQFNGTETAQIASTGRYNCTETIALDRTTADALLIGNTASLVGLRANGTNQLTASNGIVQSGNSDGYAQLGTSSTRWNGVWSFYYAGVQQTPSFSATPAFNPANGETIYFILTGNVTSWTISSGNPGQICTIHWTQDATGGRTLSGTPSNVVLSSGTFSLSSSANAVDSITLRYNSSLTKWIEESRSLATVALNSGSASLKLVSGIADSASAVGTIIDTTNSFSTNGDKVLSVRSGGTEWASIGVNVGQRQFIMTGNSSGIDGTGPFVAQTTLNNSVGTGFTLDATAASNTGHKWTILATGAGSSKGAGHFAWFDGTSSAYRMIIDGSSGAVQPGADKSQTSGSSSLRWSGAWSYTYNGVEQAPTFSATMNIDPSSGEHILVNMTSNLGAWTISSGNAGQKCTIEFIQDATGSRTIGTPPSNISFAGGTPTLTTTASKRDLFTFIYNVTASKWFEISRGMNQ